MKKSKKRKKSNTWKIKQHRDPFFKKSKTLGYRSRAAFKLIELNKNSSLLKVIPIYSILVPRQEDGPKFQATLFLQEKSYL